MRPKLTFTKNFGMKTTMEEIKAMAQEIWKVSILYPKTSKKFYHHIKFWKSIINSEVLYRKAILKNFLRKHVCLSLFLIKMQAYRSVNLLKRHSNTNILLTVIGKFLRTAILKNICERLPLRVFPFMLVWTFSYMNK